MPMQPSPRAETSRLLFPSMRFCTVFSSSYSGNVSGALRADDIQGTEQLRQRFQTVLARLENLIDRCQLVELPGLSIADNAKNFRIAAFLPVIPSARDHLGNTLGTALY